MAIYAFLSGQVPSQLCCECEYRGHHHFAALRMAKVCFIGIIFCKGLFTHCLFAFRAWTRPFRVKSTEMTNLGIKPIQNLKKKHGKLYIFHPKFAPHQECKWLMMTSGLNWSSYAKLAIHNWMGQCTTLMMGWKWAKFKGGGGVNKKFKELDGFYHFLKRKTPIKIHGKFCPLGANV